jgi:hypothetical protein
MKKILLFLAFALTVITACKKSDFADAYPDPSKVSVTSVEKQFSGFLQGNSDYVLKDYWNYFVVLRLTIDHYTQACGWANYSNQYVPGEAGIGARWATYYYMLAQYREFQKVYATQSEDDQLAKRIFEITGAIYFYDQSYKVVDLHGDIPWSEAGMLSTNGGDYQASYAAYDNAQDIYTKMLDDLKGFSDELNTIVVEPAILTGLKNQDIINHGDLGKWKKYCNSLRLKLLSRVSLVPAFQARYTSETAAILGNPSNYPVIADNADNVEIKVFNVSTKLNSSGFQSGLEDWGGNIAGKVMIDNMVTNADPRLRAMYEAGANAPTTSSYKGIDQLMLGSQQQSLIDGGTISIYNRSTLSRNKYFPGILINAAETYFYAAESYLRAGNNAAAKTAYNNGITQSIKEYYAFRAISDNNTAIPLVPTDDAEIAAYIAMPAISWDAAATNTDKMHLIATQKWIHYSVIQPEENWAELRRLNYPVLTFLVDNTNAQTQPPVRWFYAQGESTYNTANYATVSASDNLSTKIFWDVD